MGRVRIGKGMIFSRTSLIAKMLKAFRFLLARVLLPGSFSADGLGLMGAGSRVSTSGGGRVRFGCKVMLADGAEVGGENGGEVSVGNRTSINRFSRIVAHEKIEIGCDVMLAQFVTVLDHDHAYDITPGGDLSFDGYQTAAVKIGDRVWLGEKVTVLKGVTIGDNVIVGAHTLVNKNVPANCVIGGSPFRILKKLEGTESEAGKVTG